MVFCFVMQLVKLATHALHLLGVTLHSALSLLLEDNFVACDKFSILQTQPERGGGLCVLDVSYQLITIQSWPINQRWASAVLTAVMLHN